MDIPLEKKIQLFIVKSVIAIENFILEIFRRILFTKTQIKPQNILILKVGGIGDTICAVPSFIAIRKFYPDSKITLLTSSGKIGSVGARELLKDVWYIDELRYYYAEDIVSKEFRKNLINELKSKKIDLLVQIPDDWANFKILFRNLIFAKIIKAKSSFGFKVRTILNLFKNTQIDYTFEKKESDYLINLLKDNGVKSEKIEFDFNIPKEAIIKAENLIKEKINFQNNNLIIGICPGGKGNDKRWSSKKFGVVAKFLSEKYRANFIIFGNGEKDEQDSKIIKKYLSNENVFDAVNKLNVIENFPMIKKCDFLITNDTGIMHIAAAVKKPTISLFSVRNIFGKWFPFGNNHKILYKKFLKCDYDNHECVKKSLELISVEEVIKSCEEMLKEINTFRL